MRTTNSCLRAPLASVTIRLLTAGFLLGACSGADETPSDPDGLSFESRSDDLIHNPLKPLLTCMDDLGGGSYRAHFGYSNESSRTLKLNVGLLNFFVPLPANQGQPTSFTPGEHLDVFSVTFSIDQGWNRLAWWLAGRRALATRHTPLCAPPECVVADDCDDEDPCTSDACASGSCAHAPAPAGTACGHGGACDGTGACVLPQ